MSEVLERRYRRLMAVLPKQYRSARGEELLAVLMDKSGPEQRWPTLGEMFSLTGLGIRVRIGAEHEPGGSSDRGEILRVMALLSVLLLVVYGVFGAVLMIRFNADYGLGEPGTMFRLRWWQALATDAQAGWLFVYVALIRGMWRTGRVLAVVFSVMAALGTNWAGFNPLPYMTFYDLIPYVVATGAVLLSFRSGAAAVRHPRRWLMALIPAAALVILELGTIMPRSIRSLGHGHGPDVVIAMLLAAAAAVCFQAWKSPVWPIAVATAVLGSMAPTLLAVMTNPYASLGWFSEAVAGMAVGFAVLGVLSAVKQRVMRRGQVA
jgi:hypothetical protein